jgi:hypothetical protein
MPVKDKDCWLKCGCYRSRVYVASDGPLNWNNTDPWARLNIGDAGRILSFLALRFPCTPEHQLTNWFCPGVVGGGIVCVDTVHEGSFLKMHRLS